MKHDTRETSGTLAAALVALLVCCSGAHAQVAPLPPWRVLEEESSAVFVADVLEGNLSVIDSEKKAKVETAPDGKFTFGDPALFTLGIFSRVRVKEVVKSYGKVRAGDTIGVFISGYFGCDRPHFPMPKEKLVLFLRPLDPNNKELARAVIERIEKADPPRYKLHYDKFDPKGTFTPVKEGYAIVVVPPDRLSIIDKIKQAIVQEQP